MPEMDGLEVGMNDFVAKPIDVDTMFNTLAEWLPKQNTANTSQDELDNFQLS